MSPSELSSYVYQRAPSFGVDPAAALAVASQEGAGGGIGDGGTSFGPWQLHAGGALPSNVYAGPYAQSTQDWAWSPAGIDYALQQMGGCASGLSGSAAVSAIVSCFERPANPGSEIAGALANLGLSATVPGAATTSRSSSGAQGAPISAYLLAIGGAIGALYLADSLIKVV